ncbi:d-isomer specific 2-hydroxyacid dehydrogenase, nad-binding [Lacticaseibacillus thailandensis DSM 22698 = JCM 13996]|uniref:D-isomer specific 2-hydroxyacid dehydrogenase, nad-binding n=2 Tax=Lacticaseibacillus thailandensis TaxID=381741 RepID=A0A0R2C6P1_9LACO|nr:d-isomer specific 2-hydroxyacid dehydrogenase, nad-binding [Lacticaseibacillus thailandensis DSM 22698 = JCM 13996]
MLRDAGFDVEIKRNFDVYDENKIAKLIGDADAVIVGSDKVGQVVFDNCPNLKVVSKQGVGLNNVDLELAKERGIKVTNTPGANRESTAEMAWLLLMAANRNLYHEAHELKAKNGDYGATAIQSDLFGKTIGIIGFGAIGRTIARIAMGFNMKVIAYDPFLKLGAAKSGDYDANIVSLDEVLTKSDFITLHSPATKDNHHMINADAIKKMKDGVIIVNAARGELIDEDALFAALKSGKVKAAGLDVFEGEPPVGNKLLTLDNVIGTPHVGGQSVESSKNLGLHAAQNVIDNLK